MLPRRDIEWRAARSLTRLMVTPALALSVLVAGCAGSDEADLPLGKKISARATFLPTVHLFAEPVVARLEIVVDRRHLNPDRISPEARFAPYDVKDATRSREDRGRFARLEYAYTLRCLRIACIPEILPSDAMDDETGRGERRTFDLGSANVVYENWDGQTQTLTRVAWPELVSVSRIKQSDVPRYGFVFKTNATPLPEPDYRISPPLLGALLLSAAVALLALPVSLGVTWLRRSRPRPVTHEEPKVSPLERALQLVEWAREQENGTERREALELLAIALDGLEYGDHATNARALAWSPTSPSSERSSQLVESVRRAHFGDVRA